MKAFLFALFLIVASTALSQTPEHWAIQRQAVISRLEGVLRIPRDKATTILALGILADLKSKDSIPLAIPLLKHSDTNIQTAAAYLIATAPSPEALASLSEALDSYDGKNPSLEMCLGRAFIDFDDPAALPALRRAAKRGVFGAVSWALGRLGERDDFELLLAGVQQHDSMDALEGLMPLVRRSNKPFAPWMLENKKTQETGLAHKQDWQTWWDSNKADFQIIKTAKQAFEHK